MPLAALEATPSVPNHSWQSPMHGDRRPFCPFLGSPASPATNYPAGFPFHTQRSSVPRVNVDMSLGALPGSAAAPSWTALPQRPCSLPTQTAGPAFGWDLEFWRSGFGDHLRPGCSHDDSWREGTDPPRPYCALILRAVIENSDQK